MAKCWPEGRSNSYSFWGPSIQSFVVLQLEFWLEEICTGICWDQWFPETARALVLMGAEVLFYPTAIGNEPQDADLDSSAHWRRVMQGHAGANVVCAVSIFIYSFVCINTSVVIFDRCDVSVTQITLIKYVLPWEVWNRYRWLHPIGLVRKWYRQNMAQAKLLSMGHRS